MPLLLALACCLAGGMAHAQPAGRAETEHLIVEWVEGTRPELVDMAKHEGERFHAAIAAMLGEVPERKLTVLLQGPSEQPNGERKAPRVDAFGRILLYSFDPSGLSYFSALAHEMVHAMRIERRLGAEWFFEEGFAELVALRVDASLAGFPWFDYPVDLVAGQWIASGEDMPLAAMRDRHRELNMRCRAQTYSLRSSFFDYLGRTYGDSSLVAMAAQDRAGDLDDYPRFLGKDFDALAAEWREALMAAYGEIPDAAEQARRFRSESPIQYIPVCREVPARAGGGPGGRSRRGRAPPRRCRSRRRR
jgi:hypothetical protein